MKSASAGVAEKTGKEGRSDTVVNRLKDGSLPVRKIAEFFGLNVAEVENLKKEPELLRTG